MKKMLSVLFLVLLLQVSFSMVVFAEDAPPGVDFSFSTDDTDAPPAATVPAATDDTDAPPAATLPTPDSTVHTGGSSGGLGGVLTPSNTGLTTNATPPASNTKKAAPAATPSPNKITGTGPETAYVASILAVLLAVYYYYVFWRKRSTDHHPQE